MKQSVLTVLWQSLIVVWLMWSFTVGSALAQTKCNYAADIVVQARELATPNTPREQLERHNRLLERATSQCQGDGDAWYYRYLYARQLGNSREAEFFRTRAKQFDSEALRRNEDPFAVSALGATPSLPKAGVTPASEPRNSSATVSPYVREKWALVVGVSNFRDKSIPKLTYPAKDAKDFAALLQDPNYGRFKRENVATLTDEKATTVEIKRQIEELIRKAQPEDLVVFFLSSHGSPRQSSPTGVNYVVTYDTEVSSLYATSLSMVSIVDDLNKLIKAQRVVVFLDTCYSGAAGSAEVFNPRRAATIGTTEDRAGSKSLVVEGLGVSADILNRIEQSVGRVIITASQPNEVSWESETLKNGIFTYYLIEALKQSNGLVPIKDMFSYLRSAVTKRALEEKQQSQHPTLRTSEQFNQTDIRIGVTPRPR